MYVAAKFTLASISSQRNHSSQLRIIWVAVSLTQHTRSVQSVHPDYAKLYNIHNAVYHSKEKTIAMRLIHF